MNDLKMMYSLRWKHDPKREASSFVFVYDIPGITLHYQLFKNYLLKNSGNPGEDIRVSYIKDNGKECSIHSQADFQIALYTFRRSARAGNVIELLLERVSDRYHFKTLRQSNDVETQFDTPQNDTHSSCSNSAETPPEWFKQAIEELKVELKNEILTEMNSIASCFVESREFEAIELQTEKQQEEDQKEIKSSENEVRKEVELHMDARPTNVQTSFPHMLGGEVYLHQWQVQNTGQVTWDSTTELQYSWGSKNLLPVEMKVPVPFLKPGEEGVVSVCLKIPTQRGKYLCYWQFMHKERRFGQTLGVQVIVDGFEWKNSPKSDSEMMIDYETKDIPEQETKVVENNATEPENTTTQTTRSNSIKLRDEEQSLIPQQAVDLTTSPRDRRKYYSVNPFTEPNTQQLEEHENVLNSNNILNNHQTALNPVGVQNGNENWISTLSPREQNLQALAAMGFWNFDLNSTLLDRYNNDINQTVAELVR